MGEKMELYGVVEDGELYFETLSATAEDAIDQISEDRHKSYVGERAKIMAGRIRVHRLTVEIGEPIAPDEYPIDGGDDGKE